MCNTGYSIDKDTGIIAFKNAIDKFVILYKNYQELHRYTPTCIVLKSMLCFSYMGKLIGIGKAAKLLGVSIDTLRRWDNKGLLKSLRVGENGHRYYRQEDLDLYLKDLFSLAKNWACSALGEIPPSTFYCQTSSTFQAKLEKFVLLFSNQQPKNEIISVLGVIAGEIGHNSFDHNIGNWPDIPGIFFGYDINKKEIVLADRGQGILKTLSRVKQTLHSDEEALNVAFTEVISGRKPEQRGNGLKLVKKVVEESKHITVLFQTGKARLELFHQDSNNYISDAEISCRGCIALIRF